MHAATSTLLSLALLSCANLLHAADNTLTEAEKADGWELLFNGKDHTGWKNNNGKPVAAPIEDGALVPYKSGGYILMHERKFGDFILKCDVKMPEKCNSGIFFRIGNPKNPVQTGFEIQVMTGKGTGRHDFGAIYDLVGPSVAAAKPVGQWNHVTVTCKGPHISVEINGKKVAGLNADEYTEAGKNPDGTRNKFKTAIKDFPREGYLGFQDHGHKVWFKNVKIKGLK